MLKFFSIIIIHLLFLNTLHSQTFNPQLDTLIDTFKSFNYQGTIDMANNLIADSVQLNEADLCEINRLKAISYYSLLNMQGALKSFIEILKINPDYTLNPEHNSPKIIDYFEEIRENFPPPKADYEPEIMTPDSLLINHKIDTDAMTHNISNKTLLYSLLLPGLGHVTTNASPKSWLLFSAGMVMLGSSIYYIVDTNQREKDYLNASDKLEIESKYATYNTSYKRRNFFIMAYAAIWLYSQIDLLFFSQYKSYKEPVLSFNINTLQPYQQMIAIQIIF